MTRDLRVDDIGSWTFRASSREAIKNTLSTSGRAWIAVILAVVVGSFLSMMLLFEDQRFQRVLHEQYLGGRNTIVFSAVESGVHPPEISVQSCVRLGSVPGVTAAGPIQFLGVDEIAQVDASVSIVATTSSLVRELSAGLALVGYDLPFEGVTRLRSAALSGLLAGRGGRSAGGVPIDSAVVVQISPYVTRTLMCVTVLDPRADAVRLAPVLAALVDVVGNGLTARAFLAPQFDPIDDYRSRTGRWLPAVLGTFIGFANVLVLRFRGSEIAAYRLVGTSRVAMLRILWLEQTVLAGLLLTSGALAAFLCHPELISLRASLLRLSTCSCAWLAVFQMCSIAAVRQNPMNQAKDR